MDLVLDRPSATDADRELRAQLVARAEALIPLLSANAARTEKDRRVPDENIAALVDAGLFSLLRPARYGGLETDVRTALEVQQTLARGCASTAWVLGLGIASSYILAMFPERAQEDVWGEEPENRIALVSSTVQASAHRSEGGWTVTGRFPYASGSSHAAWAVIGIPFEDSNNQGNLNTTGMGLLPIGDLTIEDTWHMAGMRGTASNTLVLDEVFIPDHRIVPYAAAYRTAELTPYKDSPLYRTSFGALFGLCLVASQIGSAEAALSEALRIFSAKTESPLSQVHLADAAGLIDSAILHLYRAAADSDEAGHRNQTLSDAARMRGTMDGRIATRFARQAIRDLIELCGTSTFKDGALQRHWRDAEVASSHIAFTEGVAVGYGRALLGLPLGLVL